MINQMIKKSKLMKNKLNHIKEGFMGLIEKASSDVTTSFIFYQANMTSELRSFINSSKGIVRDLDNWGEEAY